MLSAILLAFGIERQGDQDVGRVDIVYEVIYVAIFHQIVGFSRGK